MVRYMIVQAGSNGSYTLPLQAAAKVAVAPLPTLPLTKPHLPSKHKHACHGAWPEAGSFQWQLLAHTFCRMMTNTIHTH
jgi:hypothetical protein